MPGKRKRRPNPKYADGVPPATRKSSRKKQQEDGPPATPPTRKSSRNSQKDHEQTTEDEGRANSPSHQDTSQVRETSPVLVENQAPPPNPAVPFADLGKVITDAITSYFAKTSCALPVTEEVLPTTQSTVDHANMPIHTPPSIPIVTTHASCRYQYSVSFWY